MRIFLAILLIVTSLIGFVMSYGFAYRKVTTALIPNSERAPLTAGINDR